MTLVQREAIMSGNIVVRLTGFALGMAIAFAANTGFAATGTKACTIEASGGACLFDITANAAGTLSGCTKATGAGQRWRASVFQVNVNGSVSSIGTGSTAACTGSVSRSTAAGVKYILAVTYDGPVDGTYPKTAQVTINAPTGTIPNPRPCYAGDDVTSCTVDPQNVVCGFDLSCTLTVGDIDTYRFSAPVGAVVVIKVCGDKPSNRWYLYDPQAKEMAASIGYGVSPSFTSAGTYSIQVRNTSNAPNTYWLSMQGVSEAFRCAVPIFNGGQPIKSSLSSCADLDGYWFKAMSGQRYTIAINGPDGLTNWYLYDPKGVLVTKCFGTCQTPPLPVTGNYTIVASNSYGTVGTYTLSLNLASGAASSGAGAQTSGERLPETVITDDEKPPTKSLEVAPAPPSSDQ
jgi:hypothetical protein